MAKKKRMTFDEKVQAAVAAELAKRGPSPGPAPSPPTSDQVRAEEAAAKKKAAEIAATHATANFARRAGAPPEVVEEITEFARALEREA